MSNIEQRFQPRYEPAPHVPSFFKEGLTVIGGLNAFGEPNLNLVWGMDAKVFRRGNPNAIKYIGKDSENLGMPAWVVEEWWSPERFGSAYEWEKHRYFRDESGNLIDAIGEYPSRGRYYMMSGGLLLNELGVPSSLTESTLEYIAGIYKNRLAPIVSDQDNARRYREMLDKQAEMETAQRRAMEDADNTDWETYLTNKDKAHADTTREFSFAKNFEKKGSLFLPKTI